MPGGVSGPFCSGIQFGEVDCSGIQFGGPGVSSSTTSDKICGDQANRRLNKFKKVSKKEWKGKENKNYNGFKFHQV